MSAQHAWHVTVTGHTRFCGICGIRINFTALASPKNAREQSALLMSAETHSLSTVPRVVTETHGCECFQFNDPCPLSTIPEHNYVFHPHCWTWLERVYGEAAMQRKDLVLAALGKWWVGSGDRDRLWSPRFFRGVTIKTQDPVHVAPLRALVQRVKNGTREAQITRRQTRSRSVQNSFVRADFPLDVVLLILDQLPGAREVYYATLAFGWRLPAAYWKVRFPCQLVFEIDELDLDELDDHDWKYLYGEYVRMMCLQKPPGFHNRQRIFRILERTKEDFLNAMEEDNKKRKRAADEMLSAG